MATTTHGVAGQVTIDLRGLEPAEQVRRWRRALGLSQWDLAQRMGVPQTTVSLAERGRGGADRIEAVLRALAETERAA